MDMEEITLHNASQPLLKLPQELKERIFGYVCRPAILFHGNSQNERIEVQREFDSSTIAGWRAGCKSIFEDRQYFRITFLFGSVGFYDNWPARPYIPWLHICKQLNLELKHLPANHTCLYLRWDWTYDIDSWCPARYANIKYLNFASGTIKTLKCLNPHIRKLSWLRETLDLVSTIWEIPKWFPSLQLLGLDYHIADQDEKVHAPYIEFKTPEQILSDVQKPEKAVMHDLILQAVLGLVYGSNLRQMIVSSGDGLWKDDQMQVWQDYIDKTLEEKRKPRQFVFGEDTAKIRDKASMVEEMQATSRRLENGRWLVEDFYFKKRR